MTHTKTLTRASLDEALAVLRKIGVTPSAAYHYALAVDADRERHEQDYEDATPSLEEFVESIYEAELDDPRDAIHHEYGQVLEMAKLLED